MLEWIKAITLLLAAVSLPIVLFCFRGEVRKLVNWITSLTHLQKSKDGFALTANMAANPPALQLDSRETLAIAAIRIDELELVASKDSLTTGEREDSWQKAQSEKRYADAIRLVARELESEVEPNRRLMLRGLIGYLTFEDNSERGIEYFEKLVIEVPNRAASFDWYAIAFQSKNLDSKSLEVLNRGMIVVVDPEELIHFKAQILLRVGRLTESYEVALEGVRQAPSFVSNYLTLAKIEVERNDKAASKTWFQRALVASNGSESVRTAYAAWLYDNDFHEEAILIYQSLTTDFPNDSTYRTLLGNTYLACGFEDLALESYFQADKIADGREGWILSNIGNVFRTMKLYGQAEVYLRRAVALEPDSQYAIDKLAITLKEREDAAKRLDKLLKQARIAAAVQLPPLPPGGRVVLPMISESRTEDPDDVS
jgi:tetratricopeptide (TPR) repeat protein